MPFVLYLYLQHLFRRWRSKANSKPDSLIETPIQRPPYTEDWFEPIQLECRRCGNPEHIQPCVVCKELLCANCRFSPGATQDYVCVDTCVIKSFFLPQRIAK